MALGHSSGRPQGSLYNNVSGFMLQAYPSPDPHIQLDFGFVDEDDRWRFIGTGDKKRIDRVQVNVVGEEALLQLITMAAEAINLGRQHAATYQRMLDAEAARRTAMDDPEDDG